MSSSHAYRRDTRRPSLCSATYTVLASLVLTTPALAVPPGFVDEVFVAGLAEPTDLEFGPGDRIFVAQQSGVVRVIENGALLPTPFLDINERVNQTNDRGLLGIALHPDFPQTPWLYALYTHDPPEAATSTGNGQRDQPGQRSSRLERFVANSATNFNTAISTNGTVLAGTGSTWANNGEPDGFVNDVNAPWACYQDGAPVRDCIPSDSTTHSIGTVAFGPDGMLYFASGDGASPGQVDDRAMRTFNLDSMTGKLFRVDPASGNGPADNPWFNGDPTSNRSKVVSLGLRNPYRFVLHPQTGEPFFGDVGWATWEEINQGWGVNFGWPCYEGGSGVNIRQAGYQALAECQTYYQNEANGTAATAAPIWAYNRLGSSGAAMASAVYTGTTFPSDMHGALLISDYTQNWIRYIPMSNGQPLLESDGTAQVREFGNSVVTPVDVAMGPDENLYYVSFFQNQVRRIRLAGALDVDYEYYEGDWNVLPDFDSLTPTKTGAVANFDPSPREQDDFFGFRWDTCVNVPNQGSWRFFTRSDDGSKLYINGGLVVDNDGLHATVEQSGFVTLSAGLHTIRVEFFDKTQAEFLEVGWEGPGIATQTIPTSAITSCSGENRAPTITSPGAQTSSIDQQVSLFVEANDPDGDVLTYSATGLPTGLNIDSSSGEIFGAATTAQSSVVEVTSSDGNLDASVTFPWIVVTNRAPTATITTPSGQGFNIGDQVDFAGFGDDPEDGTLAASALSWVGRLHHLDHTHPSFIATGFGGTFTFADHDDEIFIRLCLTATDSESAASIDCVDVPPRKASYSFASSPSSVPIDYNGISRPAPFVVQIPIGATRNLSAPQTHNGQPFVSWSNGGARSQVLQIGDADQSFTAVFGGGSSEPTHLHVTTPGGYRHLKVGHSSQSVWSPRIDPTAGAQTHLRLELRDFAGNADWDRLVIAPQGVGSKGVSLGDHISGQPSGWFTVQIPLTAFAADAFSGGVSHLSLPFSEDVAAFEIGIARVEFVGGATPFLWFGAPEKTDNAFQGSGGGGELQGELVLGSGGPTNAAAEVLSPSPGSTLAGTTATFQWSDTGADSYRLRIGPSAGVWSFHDQDHGGAASATVAGLPDDGSTLVVRLESTFSDPAETLSRDHTYMAHQVPTGEVSTYFKITNPGGYRHFKLGYGTSHIWAPNLSPGTGNTQLVLQIRDALGNAPWDSLEVAPGGDTTAGRRLGDFIVGQPQDWFTVTIPLSAFPSGAWEGITHMNLPFSRDAPNFEIHIGRIEFTGGNPFVWFGAPEKTDNAFQGNSSGGELEGVLITE